ncbi:MAG: spore maturation protein [Vampirovibrionia bacterium]
MLKEILNNISIMAIPFILLTILLYASFKRVKVYESFVEGAKEGFDVGIRIIPYLVAILVAIGMFQASGAIELISQILAPALNLIGMPVETLPLAIVRPLSGSGSFAIMTQIVDSQPIDSFTGWLAATMTGSTETTFYVLAVYFGSVGVYKARHSVIAGLISDVSGILASLFICKILFS